MFQDRKRFEWTESRIWLDLYRLLSYFYASVPLHQLRDDGYEYDSVKNLREMCEKAEIHELLIKIAASYRTQQDSVPGHDGRTGPKNVNPWHNACGTFWSDVGSDANEPLVLREACNKILHSDEIKHAYTHFENVWDYALEPRLELFGTRNKVKWKAELLIPRFVDCLFYNYTEA